MSDLKTTPGPWVAERRQHLSVVLQVSAKADGYSNRVAECPQWNPAPFPQPTPDDAYANALLIAAAPDLYEALFEIHEMLWCRPDIVKALRPLMGPAEDVACKMAVAALAKAVGRVDVNSAGGGL